MSPFESFINDAQRALESGDVGYCKTCGGLLHYEHDHRQDETGLDDGVVIGRTWTRRAPPKTPEELKEIRAKAWATRRAKFGKYGHR